ncbi:MAG TPA: hypothetical protein P5161_01290 [Eubacteriales bacterium]|jgi:hypothetical protein|nr:hypothetical protein [Clostridia bacterium]HRR89401.1 hypothetical protein [Eubacteriales bacterium]HRU84197.1 hypothetical protein [Eubacteriales bacterium]
MVIEQYKNFGKTAVLRCGKLMARVTLDVGPRIIHFGFEDFNFLYEDTERKASNGGEFFDKTYGASEKWYLYGGHRIWKSPETLESYAPDNYPVEYGEEGNGGVFSAPYGKSGLVAELKTRFSDCGFIIENTLKNAGENAVSLAIWPLTAVKRGGLLMVKTKNRDRGYLPAKNLVFWPYSDLKDERLFIGKNLVMLRQTKKPEPFKIGLYLDSPRAFYATEKGLLSIEFEDPKPLENALLTCSNYPDFYCNFESYTNGEFLEIEGLGRMVTLAAGESVTLREVWRVFDDFNPKEINETAVLAELEKYC